MRKKTEDKGSIVALARFRGSQQPPTRLEQAMLTSFTEGVLTCADWRRLLLAYEKDELTNEKLIEAVLSHYWTCAAGCAVLYVAMPLATKVGSQNNDEQIAARLVGILLNIYLLGGKEREAIKILLDWTKPLQANIPSPLPMMSILIEIKGVFGPGLYDEEFGDLARCIAEYSGGPEAGRQGAIDALKEISSHISAKYREQLLP